ncbi:MAG TPA: ATP-binding protein, partial [Myxococcota bacterium]|nr:ATP-binding protein [Myxococcota bacterium]
MTRAVPLETEARGTGPWAVSPPAGARGADGAAPRRERALLDSIINTFPDPILVTNTEGRLLLANARAESLFAAGEGDSEGRRRAVALNNMLLSAALSQWALGGGPSSARLELPLVDPTDGSDLLFELLGAALDDRREGTRVVSILRNITDLRRATEQVEENYRRLRIAEANVRAERDRLDLVIDSVADPILVTDPAGNLMLMNAPADRLFTATAGEGGEESERAVRANDASFSTFVATVFLGGDENRVRDEFTLSDPRSGRAIPVEAVCGKIVSEHGDVTAVVTILHDRTEAVEKSLLYDQVKRASAELQEKVREATAELVRQNELLRRQHIELEQASLAKSQFLANMSHEFRTPLNAILGYTGMLLQGVSGPLGKRPERNLQRVESNARHLLAVMNDVLDISRIEAGRMPVHPSTFDLGELVGEVMAEVEPLIARTSLEVSSVVPGRMPRLRSDRPKVKQIVLNLLTNALKFTPQGSVRVAAMYAPDRDVLAVEVTDTGIGIDDDDAKRIFDDFQQVDDSATRAVGGVGLGLSISRRLARMLGGEIMLRSRKGKGSSFALRLPRRAARRAGAVPAAKAP